MKSRIILLILSLVFATATIYAQDNKTAILGAWKCLHINDSLVLAEIDALKLNAKKDEDKMAGAFLEMMVDMMKEKFPGAVLVLEKDGTFKMKSKNNKGKEIEEKGTYTIAGDVLTMNAEEGDKGLPYKIVTANGKELALMMEQFKLIITFTKL